MHPEVTDTGPTACPKCGMHLVPAAEAAAGEHGHDHPGHEHAGHEHPGHEHAGHEHAGHEHGAALAERADPQAGYVCPMHPEVTGTGPSDCPKCGMRLVPAAEAAAGEHGHEHGHGHARGPPRRRRGLHVQTSDGAQYTCPMHPEIVRDKPGRCPICGMHLEPMVPTAGDDTTMREYRAMARRFWISVPLSLALLAITVLGFPPLSAETSSRGWSWRSRPRWCCGAPGSSSSGSPTRCGTAARTCGP